MPMVVMPALPGTARLNFFLLCKQLTTNILIGYIRKINVPSEVEVDSARNINISQRIKKLFKIFTQKI